VVPLVGDLPLRTAGGCRLDARRLAGAAKRVAGAIADGSDVVIINRFGRMETGGAGLADLITCAINASIPALIAVPERRFAALVKFASGMNVRLPCRREALDRWWRSVAAEPSRQLQKVGSTFCDVWK
jgi:nucleoside-triphosphatase THEP1